MVPCPLDDTDSSAYVAFSTKPKKKYVQKKVKIGKIFTRSKIQVTFDLQMFTGHLFQIKLHLLSHLVDFNAPWEL